MKTKGQMTCGCGAELSSDAADGRTRSECGALYTVPVTQPPGSGDGQERVNRAGAHDGSTRAVRVADEGNWC